MTVFTVSAVNTKGELVTVTFDVDLIGRLQEFSHTVQQCKKIQLNLSLA